MRIVLLGDSHLARVRRDLAQVGNSADDEVVNLAVGGSFTEDLQGQLTSVGEADVLIVSVGTNDAAPWKRLPLPRALAATDHFLEAVDGRALVYVAPPGVDEDRLTGPGDRTAAVVGEYATALSSRFVAAGATAVDTRALLAPLGPRAFTEDGVHLTGAAYDRLLPALRRAVLQTAGRPAT